MTALARQAYISPGEKVAFSGITNLKREFPHLSKQQIDDVVSSIHSYTLHREIKPIPQYNPFFIYKLRQQIQVDLIDVSSLAENNDDIHFLFVAIDCFSKKLWIICQVNKSASVTLASFKRLIRFMGDRPPLSIFNDRGTEFVNRNVREYLARQNILVHHPNSQLKAAIVERVNRSFQDILFKYLTEHETFRYIEVITELIRSYNTRYHRTIKMSPNEAEQEENHMRVASNLNLYYDKARRKQTKRPKFKVGDTVRIALEKTVFQRGYKQRFKSELFTIEEIYRKQPIVMYTLRSQNDNEVVDGKFYEQELQRHTSKEYRIEVLKSRTLKDGRRQHYVKWKDFDQSHNEWINADQLTNDYRPRQGQRPTRKGPARKVT